MTNERKGFIAAILISCIIIGAGLGFLSPSETLLVTRIETDHQIYHQAEYSEIEMDWEGEIYTDTWSEQISETNYLSTEESAAGYFVIKSNSPHRKIKADPLRKWEDYPRQHLDETRIVSLLEIRVYVELDETHEDYVRISEDKYSKAVKMIGDSVEVGTWYGITNRIKF